MDNALILIFFLSGILLALSFLYIKLDRKTKIKETLMGFGKMVEWHRFSNSCYKAQKGNRPEDRISAPQMNESIKIINDLTDGKLYAIIHDQASKEHK